MKSLSPKVRTLLFLLLFWILAVLLASWYGLGWFFFVITIRQLAIALPCLRNAIRSAISMEEHADERGALVSLHLLFQAVIIIGWIAMTIVVFLKANVRLIDLFTQLLQGNW
jgi:hypothetical protein